MRDGLLDEIECLLGSGLRADAQRAQVPESTGRVLLAVAPGEGVTMGDLARRIARDPSTTTRFVDRAAAAGLIARETGEDRRTRFARLTPRGVAARERVLALRTARALRLPEAVQARTGLGPAEVEWFLEALLEAIAGRPATPGTRA